ncbi:MAG: GGDEF domain-containing protein [Candidatus Desulfofervidaceae bacterium]|nr:GGDEF domain-containing protein [Candidatus Desulfofervidaceae bacterium]MDL1970582.1 GGDEF domain-containing protein [Candidatus Desulfofervidaceae bacterium]
MLVKDIMKRNVYTTTKGATLGTCADIMAKKGIGSVVITEENRPVNIVTESDIIKGVCLFNSIDVSVEKLIKQLKPKKKLITALEDKTYYECYQILLKHKIKHLVIVNKSGNLRGIVSYADFVQFLNDFSVKDALTSVYNKRFLEFTLEKFSIEKTKFSVVFIDLDYFKKVNDQYRHRVGDILLKEVAQFLQRSIRNTDLLFRYGGDEFTILALNTSEGAAEKMTLKLLQLIKEIFFDILGHKIKISFSAGIASNYDRDYSNLWEVIELADKALYWAKETGRGKVCVFNEKMREGRQWSSG